MLRLRQFLQPGQVASLALSFILEKGSGLPATFLSFGVPCHPPHPQFSSPSLPWLAAAPHIFVAQKSGTKEKDLPPTPFKAFIANYKRESNRASWKDYWDLYRTQNLLKFILFSVTLFLTIQMMENGPCFYFWRLGHITSLNCHQQRPYDFLYHSTLCLRYLPVSKCGVFNF